jgi:hypothetical protein
LIKCLINFSLAVRYHNISRWNKLIDNWKLMDKIIILTKFVVDQLHATQFLVHDSSKIITKFSNLYQIIHQIKTNKY